MHFFARIFMNKLHYHHIRAFSLIEVMVVVVIIGMLAGVVAIGVNDRMQTAKVTKTKSDLKQFEEALSLYYQDYDEYPDRLDELFKKTKKGTEAYVKGKKDELIKDAWGTKYKYELREGIYRITSYGKNKTAGGTSWDEDIYVTNAPGGK